MARILIADDSVVMRKQLRSIVESHSGWAVCGEAANGQKAVLLAHEMKPDLVILDLAMPMLDGLHAAAEIVKILPSVPILIYTLHVLPQMELEATKFGARAVLSKHAGEKCLIETLEGLLTPSTPTIPIESSLAPEAVQVLTTTIDISGEPLIDSPPDRPADPD